MDLIRDTSSLRPVDEASPDDINRTIADLNARLDAIWDALEQIAAALPVTPRLRF